MTRTLDTLAAWGIASDQYMAWSLHNYGDIRYDDNRAREARLLLESRGWRGWPYQDPARVYVMATEGGDVISGSSDYQRQAQRVGDNWNRMRGTAGVGMGSTTIRHGATRATTPASACASPTRRPTEAGLAPIIIDPC